MADVIQRQESVGVSMGGSGRTAASSTALGMPSVVVMVSATIH